MFVAAFVTVSMAGPLAVNISRLVKGPCTTIDY